MLMKSVGRKPIEPDASAFTEKIDSEVIDSEALKKAAIKVKAKEVKQRFR